VFSRQTDRSPLSARSTKALLIGKKFIFESFESIRVHIIPHIKRKSRRAVTVQQHNEKAKESGI
jgi:hypothetical protein